MTADSSRSAVARRLAGFAGLPILSALGPFLLLPLISRVGGVDGWAAIAAGQAIGGLGALVGGLGWGLSGPTAVAGADPARRRSLYAESIASRGIVVTALAPICAFFAITLSAEGQRATAVLMALSTLAGAIAPTWFSIGIGRPAAIARYEITPRLLATGTAAAVVATTHEVWPYPVLLLVGTLYGTLKYGQRVGKISLKDVGTVRVRRVLWRLRSDTATTVIAGAFTSTPVLVVAVFASTAELASYGSADRLYRLGLIVVAMLTNALQGWVSEPESTDAPTSTRRMKFAVFAHLVVGASGMLFLATLGPLATRLLFGADVAAGTNVSILLGIAFLIVSANSAFGRLVLVPHGASIAVLVATVSGAALGLTAMFGLGAAFGPVGVASGFALSEAVVCVVQIGSIARRQRVRTT